MGKDVGIDLPQPFELDVEATTNNSIALLGNPGAPISIGPITMNPISIDMGLDNIGMNATANIGLSGGVNVGLDGKIDMGLDDINIDMGLDNVNACLSFAIKELPSMKIHFPIDMDFGIKFLGIPLLNFGICGKAMVITEDNPKKIFYTPKQALPKTDDQKGSFSVSVEE